MIRKAFNSACSGLALLLLAAFSNSALAGDVRAYFDRKSVYEGDTVTLVIESSADAPGQPDLSALAADFDLLGTSQSTNISIVNGRRTDTIRLLVTLAPKRIGTIEISLIPVGDEQIGPLSLTVKEVPDGGSGTAGGDVFVELDVGAGSGELMVQQQVPLTVRLFTAVPLLEGSLEDPRAEGALVTKLGDDRQYSTHRDGRDYRVVERRYTLLPERSGELRIPPLAFEGSVRTAGGRRGGGGRSLFNDPFFDRFFQDSPLSRDPFGMFDPGEAVRARSRAVTLEVKARPGGYAGDHWLPAQSLEIVDSWTRDPPELRVGEPVTRTLTLQAKGLSGPQIPEIEIPRVPGLRVYPEKTESETRSDGETVYGTSRQGVTLIPSQQGELTVPEIRVTWWDTVAQEERVATVPGWTMNVAGGSGVEAAPEPAARSAGESPPEANEPVTDPDPVPEVAAESPRIDRFYLPGAFLLVGLLLALAWGLFRRRRRGLEAASPRRTLPGGEPRAGVDVSAARKALRAACQANDAPGAARALVDWGRATWQDDEPRNLGTLSARLTRGADEVRELERRLYSPEIGSWDGSALWGALQGELSDAGAETERQGEILEPLYPRRT